MGESIRRRKALNRSCCQKLQPGYVKLVKMGLRASKINLEASRNAKNKSLKSICKINNMSQYEKVPQVKLLSFKGHNATRKVSKVRFACSKEVDTNMTTYSDITESDIDGEKNRGSERSRRVHRSTISHISVTCEEHENTKKGNSSSSCTLSTISSQVIIKSIEDTSNEDEVFCEYNATSAHTTQNDNDKEKNKNETIKPTIYKRSISHLSVTCYEEQNGMTSTRTKSTSCGTEYKNNQHRQHVTCGSHTHLRTMSQVSFTCREEVPENEDTKCSSHSTPCHSNHDNGTKEKEKDLENEDKESKYTRKVSQITLTCYTETIQENKNNEGVVKMRNSSSKKRRKKTILHMYDAEIEVCRSQKEIPMYSALI